MSTKNNKKNNEPQKKESVPIFVDHSIRSIWIDGAQVHMRSDNVLLVDLTSAVPQGNIVQMRFVTSVDYLKQIVNVLQNCVDTLCKNEPDEYDHPNNIPKEG